MVEEKNSNENNERDLPRETEQASPDAEKPAKDKTEEERTPEEKRKPLDDGGEPEAGGDQETGGEPEAGGGQETGGGPEAEGEPEEIPAPEPASYLRHLTSTLRLLLIWGVICSVAYPAVLLLAGGAFWGDKAEGGIVRLNGSPVGARLIGQPFSSDIYFHPRPSSKEYDGMNSGSQNLGPYNELLTERVSARLQVLQRRGISIENVPAGWVTESGSALDPHISPAAARLQVEGVSRTTGLSREELERLIEMNTEREFLGLFGQERVNVLMLNLNIQERVGESNE